MRPGTCDAPIVVGSEVVQIRVVPYQYNGRTYHLPGDEGFFVEDIFPGGNFLKLKGYPGYHPVEWFRVWEDSLNEKASAR